MSFSLTSWFDARFFKTGNNAPLTGGKIYTYLAGTTTPAATYSDNLGTPNTNPIILDADGRANIYLDDNTSYRFILKDANDVVYFDRDNLYSIGGSAAAAAAAAAAASIRVDSATFAAIPTLTTACFVFVAADETNDGLKTVYFFDGSELQWLPSVGV